MEGIQFPLGVKGDRSTTAAGIAALSAALRPVDSNLADEVSQLSSKSFRFKYNDYYVKLVELSAQSPENALQIARAGLEYLHNSFEFHRLGNSQSIAAAMETPTSHARFHTAEIAGSKAWSGTPSISVPYGNGTLSGPALRGQLSRWARYGTIEKSAADAIRSLSEKPDWLDLRGKYFVLLGAGSAMGPLPMLLALGATVVAIDLDRTAIWQRLIELARKSPGKLIFPVKKPFSELSNDDSSLYANSGCNLFTDTPEILDWLVGVAPGEQLVVGSYAYLDGAKHVQVSLAMDAIISGLIAKRGKKEIMVASLCTPTDCFVVPQEAYAAQLENLKSAPVADKAFNTLSGGKWCVKNARRPVKASNSSAEYYICDEIARPQGPNYTLAKRIQIWRSIVAREDFGCSVSANVAPATATQSVVHAKTFAWVYSGLSHFPPMEIFQQDTSNAVMGALLVYDVMCPSSVAHPSAKKLDNPLLLFSENAFHGGMWRMAFKMDSIGEVAALVHWTRELWPVLVVLFIVFLIASLFLIKRFL
mmetsp:Transcript_1300/g.2391  ORF Transcript_1300/g.2391 Transcript_1300/m.2391 type:complete len:533 (-) Transcript_1300:30-1628(-)